MPHQSSQVTTSGVARPWQRGSQRRGRRTTWALRSTRGLPARRAGSSSKQSCPAPSDEEDKASSGAVAGVRAAQPEKAEVSSATVLDPTSNSYEDEVDSVRTLTRRDPRHPLSEQLNRILGMQAAARAEFESTRARPWAGGKEAMSEWRRLHLEYLRLGGPSLVGLLLGQPDCLRLRDALEALASTVTREEVRRYDTYGVLQTRVPGLNLLFR